MEGLRGQHRSYCFFFRRLCDSGIKLTIWKEKGSAELGSKGKGRIWPWFQLAFWTYSCCCITLWCLASWCLQIAIWKKNQLGWLTVCWICCPRDNICYISWGLEVDSVLAFCPRLHMRNSHWCCWRLFVKRLSEAPSYFTLHYQHFSQN